VKSKSNNKEEEKNYEKVSKISYLNTSLPVQRKVLTDKAYMGFL
jgi:hypothetical protein